MYKIVRFYDSVKSSHAVRGMSGLTLKQAQAHCQDINTSSKTAWTTSALARTKRYGAWFDGYTET